MNKNFLFYPFFRTAWRLFVAGSAAAWHFKWHAIRSLQFPPGQALKPPEKRRFKHYFGGATYLATFISSLQNRTFAQTEKRFFVLLSALACRFDDLVEQNGATDFEQDSPELFALAWDPEGPSAHLLQQLQGCTPADQMALFQHYLQRIFQVELQAANTTTLDLGRLQAISTEKGGASALLFRCGLAHPLTSKEEIALYCFGDLFQYCDDLFDIWQDRQANIHTAASLLAQQGAIASLRLEFEQKLERVHTALWQTPYPAIQIEQSIQILHYLVSVTRVCLDHYERVYRHHGTFPLNNRTMIVVDMEKWLNRFRFFRHLFSTFH